MLLYYFITLQKYYELKLAFCQFLQGTQTVSSLRILFIPYYMYLSHVFFAITDDCVYTMIVFSTDIVRSLEECIDCFFSVILCFLATEKKFTRYK